jgi:putative FmdB family regulatory protein
MPLHEYKCRTCGHCFEALVRGTDTPACPSCQGTELEKLLSLFAVNSETTRQSALQSGRKHGRKEQQDRLIAEREDIEHHHH